MTDADRKTFQTALRRLEIAFGAGVDPARDPVYFDAIEHFPIAAVLTAARDLERRRPPSGRFPTTHDWCDRARELRAGQPIRPRPLDLALDADGPRMSAKEFRAALDTLRKKLGVRLTTNRRHSTPTAVGQIAQSLTHPHVLPPAEPREPGEDDEPIHPDTTSGVTDTHDTDPDENPVHTDGAGTDDPGAV